MAGPGLDQGAADAEVLAGEQPALVGHRHRRVEQLGAGVVPNEPVAVLAERFSNAMLGRTPFTSATYTV